MPLPSDPRFNVLSRGNPAGIEFFLIPFTNPDFLRPASPAAPAAATLSTL
jgi:hypothetical protein